MWSKCWDGVCGWHHTEEVLAVFARERVQGSSRPSAGIVVHSAVENEIADTVLENGTAGEMTGCSIVYYVVEKSIAHGVVADVEYTLVEVDIADHANCIARGVVGDVVGDGMVRSVVHDVVVPPFHHTKLLGISTQKRVEIDCSLLLSDTPIRLCICKAGCAGAGGC